MFTGLVEEMGQVAETLPVPEGISLRVVAPHAAADLQAGDSIAVSGVCQTVVDAGDAPDGRWFQMIAIPETLARTTFSDLREGTPVNLERPLRLGDRLGGHWVQGHVDATGRIDEIELHGPDRKYLISLPATLAGYVVEKGSIAVDGVSLTIGRVQDDQDVTRFWVHIIPETIKRTRFSLYQVGDRVNLEVDILAKYVLRAAELQTTRDA